MARVIFFFFLFPFFSSIDFDLQIFNFFDFYN